MRIKYGENPHQPGRVEFDGDDPLGIGRFHLNGVALWKHSELALSEVNLCDLDRALETLTRIASVFDANMRVPMIVVIVKHGNACGAGISFTSVEQAYTRAFRGDIDAALGGVVVSNEPLTVSVIASLQKIRRPSFTLVAAPSIAAEADELLRRSSKACFLLTNEALSGVSARSVATGEGVRTIRGGKLIRVPSAYVPDIRSMRPEHAQVPDSVERDLALAWGVCSTSTSNTVSLVKDGMLIGNGVGQQKRVAVSALALTRAHDAHHDAEGAVACSDSFFPFPDGIQLLAKAGVRAVMTTSGSAKDAEVFQVARRFGVRLYVVPDTIGRGFYGH